MSEKEFFHEIFKNITEWQVSWISWAAHHPSTSPLPLTSFRIVETGRKTSCSPLRPWSYQTHHIYIICPLISFFDWAWSKSPCERRPYSLCEVYSVFQANRSKVIFCYWLFCKKGSSQGSNIFIFGNKQLFNHFQLISELNCYQLSIIIQTCQCL